MHGGPGSGGTFSLEDGLGHCLWQEVLSLTLSALLPSSSVVLIEPPYRTGTLKVSQVFCPPTLPPIA
jgi:hypothetical protein